MLVNSLSTIDLDPRTISMADPKKTIALLAELENLGFTDEAFWRVHHFRERRERHPITTHRSYCARTDSFEDDGNNERVQRRLEIVLECYRRYHTGNPAVFPELADAAYRLVPALPH